MQLRKTIFNTSWTHLLKVVPSGVLLPVSAGVKLRRGAMNKEATSLRGKELVCAHTPKNKVRLKTWLALPKSC